MRYCSFNKSHYKNTGDRNSYKEIKNERLFNHFKSDIFLFGFIVIGYVLVKLKVLSEDSSAVLSKLENTVFIPALVMGTFIENFTVERKEVFSSLANENGPEYYLYDGVHPTIAASKIIADEWLRVFNEYMV